VAEADVAEKVLHDAFGFELQYKGSSSRDTQENAAKTSKILSMHGIKNIALITHSTHMPRAGNEFKENGFDIIESCIGQSTADNTFALSLLPNTSNLEFSQNILRELLASLVQRLKTALVWKSSLGTI
jgi:uncharacterized SAM-binding protein YcdF (DUF218 family)